MFSEYLHVVSDPAHIMAELTFIAGEGLVGLVIGRILIKRHDRKFHSKPVDDKSEG